MKTALVVDDEDKIAQLVKQFLEIEGFKVETAGNVGEALSRLSKRYGLVVTDFNLPGGSGCDVIVAAKAHPNVKVLCISGRDENELKAAGADLFLSKPFNLQDLRTAIGLLGQFSE